MTVPQSTAAPHPPQEVAPPATADPALYRRFRSKVRGPLYPDACWFWTDKPNQAGYGELSVRNSAVAVHHLTYAWWRGELPAAPRMSRTCDTVACVNPWHFQFGYVKPVWNKKSLDPTMLRECYVTQRLSTTQIAARLGVNKSVVVRHLHAAGIPVRTNSEAHIGNVPHNKRGWTRSAAGYTHVRLDRNSAYGAMVGRNGYVLRHRLVMAQHLGRCLEAWEIVHHKDHDRGNDALDNLELIQRATEHHGETFAHQALLALKAENAQLRAYISELERAMEDEL